MASIALNYDSIYDAAKHAKKVASTAEDYVLKLQTKIINNIDSLSGANTNYTTEAKMQVSKKMMHLYDKRDIYEEYGLKLEQFIENEEYGAKAVDQRVAELFQSEGGFPKKKKKNKSVGSRVFTFLSNAVQTAGEFAYDVLLDITYAVNWVVGELPGKIDYWYEHQGGKYIINPLLKAGAIILLFVSLPYAGVAILAVKALLLKKIVDLPISIYNNMRAYEESQNGNKEIAEYYSSIDTCAKEIGANTNNKITIALTKGIDFTEFTLEMVLMVQGLFQLGDCIIQKIAQKIGNANIAEEVRNSYNVVDDFGDDVVGKGGNASIKNILKKTTCNNDELCNYISKNVGADTADLYAKTGKWPDGLQVPKDNSVLSVDGSINWSKAPKGGYVLDASGNAVKESFTPQMGEIIDRYGPANGRYTSPVVDGKTYSYAERSLPYVEDASSYHQYEVVGDFTKIEEYVNNCTDVKLKTQIDASVTAYYDGDYSTLISYKGKAALVDGWGTGGATQYEFSLTVEQLEKIGLLKEIK